LGKKVFHQIGRWELSSKICPNCEAVKYVYVIENMFAKNAE